MAPPAPKLRLAFLGDSITVGDGDRLAKGWPARLLESSSPYPTRMHAYNLGVGGDRIADVARRSKAELSARLSGKDGTGTVIMAGLNDALRASAKVDPIKLDSRKICADFQHIIQQAKSHGPVLAVEPTPVTPDLARDDGGKGQDVLDKLAVINDLLRAVCSQENVVLIPLTNALCADAGYTLALKECDGLHPLASGYEIVAAHITAQPTWHVFLAQALGE